MRFTKMHGLGNDYLFVYGDVPDDIEDICRRLSDRHFGAGSDGMIYISPSGKADFAMRIFNADGSEAEMCGNGIRCVGKYVYDRGYTDRTSVTVETLAGIRTLSLNVEDGKVVSVSVDMGKASVGGDREVSALGRVFTGTEVSMGNPHFVVFTGDAEKAEPEKYGPVIEKDPSFPEGVNVEFAEVSCPGHLRMRVWERGSGVTMACGTGACAAAAAAVNKGLMPVGGSVTVRLDGGELIITVSADGNVTMRGPAVSVYDGEVNEC